MLRRCFVAGFALAATLSAQTTSRQVGQVLAPALHSPDVTFYQLRQYLMKKAPVLQAPRAAADWEAESRRLRRRILDEVVFHGWPREWVEAPLKVEDLGAIPSGPGYRLRKLRYEIVPGFWSSAILYEPEKLQPGMPAILNVNGHVGPPGKSVEYKQKRCVQQARMGIVNLNLEWLSFGELNLKENQHWFGAHLDLVGANCVGLFYLAMRKGLDYLAQHPNVDRARMGVTGLSGGGWQTIVLSSLDERVAVAVPVAGFSASVSRIARFADVGDIEQNPTDFLAVADYPHLTALRAPRPTLLVYNAEDDCCFRAPLVKPFIYDRIQPFFALSGKQANLAWHENTDPSDHNYQLDNRTQSYRFIARHFGLPEPPPERDVAGEVKSYEELVVGLPKDNLTILGLARKLAAAIHRSPGSRERLQQIVRYRPVSADRSWPVHNTKNKGLESVSWRFDFSDGLSATAVMLKAIAIDKPATGTLVLDDRGKKEAGEEVSERVNRGEYVLAADLLFTGDAGMEKPPPTSFTQLLASAGDRPLGMQAAQLTALAGWFRRESGVARLRLEARGLRMQTVATLAAALDPKLFEEVVIRSGIRSLGHLLDAPVEYRTASDLFCLDLYKEFDLDRMRELAAPTRFP